MGVPQGNLLGPLLFNYADDTTLVANVSDFGLNVREQEENINKELNKVSQWVTQNRLKLNVNKSKLMYFKSMGPHKSVFLPTVTMNGTLLEKVEQFNFLGILLDKNLNWKAHCQHVCSKISGALHAIRRVNCTFPKGYYLCFTHLSCYHI